MNSTWLKIKVWTKISVFGIISLLIVVVLSRNWDTRVSHLDFLFVKYENPRLLLVLFLTSIFSIFGWWIFKTVFKTIRQLRDVRRRAHLERIEKEHADMLAKAAKLQTKPEPGPGATT